MKFLNTFIFLILSFLIVSTSGARTATQKKAEKLIIWIHGIGSSKADTGVMKETLEKHLPRINNSKTYRFEFFDYDTLNPKLTITDFKNSLENYMTETEANLSKTTKVDIVAHSQGGLIIYLWLSERCVSPQNIHPICKRIESLTTLGSPLWGSRMANLAYGLKEKFGDILHLADFGKAQLKDLSLLSDATYKRLQLFSGSEHENFRNLFRKQIRLKVIRGHAPINSKIWGAFFPGHGMVEDDMSVPVVSTDPQVTIFSGRMEHKISIAAQYYMVKSMHMPSLKSIISKYIGSEELAKLIGIFDYSSLTDVQRDCLSDSLEQCTTPVVKPIINSILNRPDPVQKTEFRSFALIGKINLSKALMDQLESQADALPMVVGPDELGSASGPMIIRPTLTIRAKMDPKVALISDARESYSNFVLMNDNELRFHFSGFFSGRAREHLAQVELVIGTQVVKTFSVRVHGGMTSFLVEKLNENNFIQ